jgi:hypothetical protein
MTFFAPALLPCLSQPTNLSNPRLRGSFKPPFFGFERAARFRHAIGIIPISPPPGRLSIQQPLFEA